MPAHVKNHAMVCGEHIIEHPFLVIAQLFLAVSQENKPHHDNKSKAFYAQDLLLNPLVRQEIIMDSLLTAIIFTLMETLQFTTIAEKVYASRKYAAMPFCAGAGGC